METTKHERFRKGALKGIFGSMFFLFISTLSYGFYDGAKTHSNNANDIERSLREHCNCEKVIQNISAYGIQFSKEGVSNKRVSYTLQYCDELPSLEENEKLTSILREEIEHFETIDLVSLDFESDNTKETLIIKKGIILQ